jgi:phage-related protein
MIGNSIPDAHIRDAQKLDSDGLVSLYTLYPRAGGRLDFKDGPEITYQGILYESLPSKLSGQKWTTDGSDPTPRLIIGQPDFDLLPIKGLVHDGYLDGGTVIQKQVLLDDLLKDIAGFRESYFRIKRVESYNRVQLTLLLATASGASGQPFPNRQYTPPAFPWVTI